VLGSHYEGSGYALSEALRCGCIPVITDIPSFRMMTDEGRLGALWQTDNKLSFVEAAKKAISKPIQAEGNYCISYFNHKLSFEAIARLALQYFRCMAKQ
jgi:glycosyltransferase involved in cell wall biosynthesis